MESVKMFIELCVEHFTREEQASRMNFGEENITHKEMLEKIAELDYSQSHLRDLNAKMRHWLDVADDDMAVLRSENTALSQQVKVLEKIISDAQRAEAEPCRSLQADDLDTRKYSETEIEAIEKEYTTLKKQNKELSTELKNLHQERDEEKINLRKFKDSFQSLELTLEEAHLDVQRRDEVIDQKNWQLQHSEDTVEECYSVIKELRLTNQELRMQLEDRLDEASFAVLNDMVKEKEEPLSPPLSFAEEMKLLASSPEVETIILNTTDLEHEETGAEEQLKPQSLTVDLPTKRCAGTLKSGIQRALFLFFVFFLAILLFVASGDCAGNFSVKTILNGARLMLQPYWRVHYGALPPI